MFYSEMRTIEHIDTDASGVVHFSRYAVFFETVLLNFLIKEFSKIGKDAELLHQIRIANLEVQFIQPSKFSDKVKIFLSFEKVGIANVQASFILQSLMSPDTRVKGLMKICCVNEDGAVTRIPEFMQEIFRRSQCLPQS